MRVLTAIILFSLGPQASAPEAPPFDVPEGFEVVRVAGPPLVERPIMACHDDEGRLYVTDSAGVNHRGSELLKNPPHRIRILEDKDGDGVYDTSRVWADKLVFPQGLLWHDGAVYVTSPPAFWKLEDTTGDGLCDTRTRLITGLANTGVADDAHGACLGPDGRIYFLPGRMHHEMKLADGTPLRKAVGPWLVRMRPDGSEVEIVCGAQGNPVEVDWTPEGDYFISGTFWAPASFGGGLRDALVHGVEGGEWPVRDRTYNDRIRTGPHLPVLVRMVATAPSGMMVYRSGAFGPEYRGNLFCTYFNPHKVQRHVLERDGATWRSRNEEFITSSNADFHPTDVLEDADGSLLVVDTGGWFRIGCPHSKIAKPQVLGGIYRIRKKGMPKVEDARGLKLDWSNPGYSFLEDPRFAVRWRAMRELARAKASKPPAGASRRARLHAVWTLARIGNLALIRDRYLKDEDAGVRQAAATAAGLHRDGKALQRLAELVRSDAAHVRREAATALGRIGSKEAVPALLQALRDKPDRYLEHSCIYALIRIADRASMLKALKDEHAGVRKAALIALDQMKGGDLASDHVTPLLDTVDQPLRTAALEIIMRHPSWAGEIYGMVGEWMARPELGASDAEHLRGVISAFAGHGTLQDLVARGLRRKETSARTRLLLLEAIADAPLDRCPPTWIAEVRWSLDHDEERIVRQAVSTLRKVGAVDFDEPLLRIARGSHRSHELRVDALAAVSARLSLLEPSLFDFLESRLKPENPPLLRLVAAEALGKAPLDQKQLMRLASIVKGAGALELPRLVGAFARSRNASVGRKFLESLGSAPGLESVSPDALRAVLKSYPSEITKRAAPLLKRLAADSEKQEAKLRNLRSAASGGDAARGRRVFFGKKAGCTACHTIQGKGGRVGPDLTKIGSIRSGDDLLEAIVFPSATFARTYEPFVIRTKDGEVHDGLVTRETADAIYLFTTGREEKRISRQSIDAIRESRVSIMPQGLDNQLSRSELQDLIAYLRALK